MGQSVVDILLLLSGLALLILMILFSSFRVQENSYTVRLPGHSLELS
jgi:hypothetical protein